MNGNGSPFEVLDRPGFGSDPQSVRIRVEAMERVLERTFTLPVINRQVGLDALGGLVPVFGDVMTAALGGWMVWEAKNLGVPRWKLWRMGANLGFDMLLGLIPFVGDAADFLFRSNTRNLRLLKRHLDQHHPETRTIDG